MMGEDHKMTFKITHTTKYMFKNWEPDFYFQDL